jgi:hypothetical protein
MYKTPLEKLEFICSMTFITRPHADIDYYDETDVEDHPEYALTYGDLRDILQLIKKDRLCPPPPTTNG